ncbi:hypothetical protein C5Y96_18240 [Blastopirellula marina]|uniref:Carrier domain-containing protein n=1 Tax=Blastopirellula marina TaxID=124 RepID=A0A2S8F5P3_9BACT|nr:MULTISPECIES: hypothetical protein [Pirellulaceae]PQO27476.1 hypothetical protein C5Y96_18240 [Blastopirellula marina]RCS48013.1 hypothetical protein DTL36_18265 [Bremerella cremea]
MFLLWIAIPLVAVGLIVACVCFSPKSPTLEKWPPISDDEFIRRCSPGVDRELALKVRRIVAEQLGVDYERVYPEQRFVEDLGA